uniref:Vacuolar import/degradation Vid27 C-terminal domain-containing protein n=1 Tax=Palpitomonas bilix TaxID=652834 RepID=A0A7S3D7Y6_9EUKA|mmetsp:Transcript_26001/g.66011  ORF Transcript_26001/g.66011 Transcript_26001/m.66011 type:complete len:379 (+) Transcript_26001:77-1213(+)
MAEMPSTGVMSPPSGRAGSRHESMVAFTNKDTIGIYIAKNERDGTIGEDMSFRLTDDDGNRISWFSNALLHQRGERVIVQGKPVEDSLYFVDVERQALAQTLNLKLQQQGDTFRIIKLVSLRLHQQYEQSAIVELAGLGEDDSNSIVFTVFYDTRTKNTSPAYIIDKESYASYKSVKFTSIATAGNCYVITGDSKGTVRLYDNIAGAKVVAEKKASMTLKKEGDDTPVRDVAVNFGAGMILWTTDKSMYAACLQEEHWHNGWAAKKVNGEKLSKPHIVCLTTERNLGEVRSAARFDASSAYNGVDVDQKDEKFVFGHYGESGVTWSLAGIAEAARKEIETLNGRTKGLGTAITDHQPVYNPVKATDLVGNPQIVKTWS